MADQWLPTNRCFRFGGKVYKHGDVVPVKDLSSKVAKKIDDDLGTVKKKKAEPEVWTTTKKKDKK